MERIENFLRVPNRLLYDEDLNLNEKILLADIISFHRSELVYYKTNAQIQDFLHTGRTTVIKTINTLKVKDIVKISNSRGRNRELILRGRYKDRYT